jgi:hypothetical protein
MLTIAGPVVAAKGAKIIAPPVLGTRLYLAEYMIEIQIM